MRKFFSCFPSMWPIPAKSRPVIESYATENISAAQHGPKDSVRVTSSPMTAKNLRSLNEVVMDVTVTKAQLPDP